MQIGFILETQSSHCQSAFLPLSGPKPGLSKINKCYYIFIHMCSNIYFIHWFHLKQLNWFNWIYIHMNVKKQKAGPDNKVYFQSNYCEKRTLEGDSCLISTSQLNYFLSKEENHWLVWIFQTYLKYYIMKILAVIRVISSLITCKTVELHLWNMKTYLYILETYKLKIKCQWKIISFSQLVLDLILCHLFLLIWKCSCKRKLRRGSSNESLQL